jgi:hypothetical protein
VAFLLITHMGNETSSVTYHQLFSKLTSFPDYEVVYTDRLFVQESAEFVFMYEDQVVSHRLHSFNSTYMAELYAIY